MMSKSQMILVETRQMMIVFPSKGKGSADDPNKLMDQVVKIKAGSSNDYDKEITSRLNSMSKRIKVGEKMK